VNAREIRRARARFGNLAIAMSPEENKQLLVLRPDDTAKALALARQAMEENDAILLQEIPVRVQDYTFVGYLSRPVRDGKEHRVFAVDKHGKIVDAIQPGDSFVTVNDEFLSN
jgi:hypothetical protein